MTTVLQIKRVIILRAVSDAVARCGETEVTIERAARQFEISVVVNIDIVGERRLQIRITLADIERIAVIRQCEEVRHVRLSRIASIPQSEGMLL